MLLLYYKPVAEGQANNLETISSVDIYRWAKDVFVMMFLPRVVLHQVRNIGFYENLYDHIDGNSFSFKPKLLLQML